MVVPHSGLFLEYAPIARNLSQPIWSQPATTAQLLKWVDSGWNMSRAQVLDYWLDESLASSWKRGHQVKLPFHSEVVAEDATFCEHLAPLYSKFTTILLRFTIHSTPLLC